MITEEDAVVATFSGLSNVDYDERLANLKQQAKEHPDWANVRRTLVTWLQGQRAPETLDTLAELAELCPDDPWIFSKWVLALRSTNNGDEARRVAKAYLARHPTDFKVIAAAGDLESYENGYAGNEDNVLFLENYAMLLSHSKRGNEAVAVWEAVLRELDHPIFNDNMTAEYSNFGYALVHLERYSEAIEAFQQAVERDPERWYAWHKLGQAFEAVGQPVQAMEAYQNALRIIHSGRLYHYDMRDWADLCERIGRLLTESGKTEEATPYFEQAKHLKKELYK